MTPASIRRCSPALSIGCLLLIGSLVPAGDVLASSSAAVEGKRSAPAADEAMMQPVGRQSDARMAGRDDEPPESGSLSVSLEILTRQTLVSEPLELRVTAYNGSNRSLALLIWQTPFEPTLSADLFDIERDGKKVDYRGRMVKRLLPPPAKDYRQVDPGQSVARVLDLADHYALDEPGTYTLRYTPFPFNPSDSGIDGAGLVGDRETLTFERLAE